MVGLLLTVILVLWLDSMWIGFNACLDFLCDSVRGSIDDNYVLIMMTPKVTAYKHVATGLVVAFPFNGYTIEIDGKRTLCCTWPSVQVLHYQ